MSTMLFSAALAASPGAGEAWMQTTQAVVQGTVTSIEDCGEGGRTFVEVDVHRVLRGKVLDEKGNDADVLSVGLPYGAHADGTWSMAIGLPALAKGEEIVLGLRSHADGTPSWQPLPLHAASVLRKVDVDGFGPAWIDGSGRPVVTFGGVTSFGTALPDAEMTLGERQFAAIDQVEEALSLYLKDPAYWDAPNSYAGPIVGGVRIEASGDYDSSCLARLEGEVDSKGEVTLYGRCNASYVGVVDVVVEGTLDAKGFTGTLTADVPAVSDATETVNLSTLSSGLHSVHLSASGTTTAKGVTASWSTNIGFMPEVLPTLAGVEEVQAWLDDAADATADTYGTFISTPQTKTSCATSPSYL